MGADFCTTILRVHECASISAPHTSCTTGGTDFYATILRVLKGGNNSRVTILRVQMGAPFFALLYFMYKWGCRFPRHHTSCTQVGADFRATILPVQRGRSSAPLYFLYKRAAHFCLTIPRKQKGRRFPLRCTSCTEGGANFCATILHVQMGVPISAPHTSRTKRVADFRSTIPCVQEGAPISAPLFFVYKRGATIPPSLYFVCKRGRRFLRHIPRVQNGALISASLHCDAP